MRIGIKLGRGGWRTAIIAGLMALSARTVAAQPLFEIDHDWTMTIGGETFGLRQVAMSIRAGENEFQYTVIYLGPYDFHMRIRAMHLLTGIGMIAAGIFAGAAIRRIEWRRFFCHQTEAES